MDFDGIMNKLFAEARKTLASKGNLEFADCSELLKGPPPDDAVVILTLPADPYIASDYRAWLGKCFWSLNGYDHNPAPLSAIPEAIKDLRAHIERDPLFPCLLRMDEKGAFGNLLFLLATLCNQRNVWTGATEYKSEEDYKKRIIERSEIHIDIADAIKLLTRASEALAIRTDDETASNWFKEAFQKLCDPIKPAPETSQPNKTNQQPQPNDACPCGSGKKFKKCCQYGS